MFAGKESGKRIGYSDIILFPVASGSNDKKPIFMLELLVLDVALTKDIEKYQPVEEHIERLK